VSEKAVKIAEKERLMIAATAARESSSTDTIDRMMHAGGGPRYVQGSSLIACTPLI